MGNKLCFNTFTTYVKKIESIEKYIVVKNNKLNTHIDKWRNGQPTVQENIDEIIQEYVFQM